MRGRTSWPQRGRRNGRVLGSILVALMCLGGLAACTDDDTTGSGVTGGDDAVEATPLAAADADRLAAQIATTPGCDPLDPTACLLPFPNDRFTTADPSTDTGRRVALPATALTNASGVALDTTEWNRNDGFSPGSPVLVNPVGVDPERSHLPPIGDIGASLDPDSGTVLVDMDTGERLAHWAELDAEAASPDRQLLIVHPAVNLPVGHRIAVGLVDLRDADDEALEAPLSFRVYRDRLTTEIDEVESRRDAIDAAIAALSEEGVARDELWMAWDFTVASDRNLTERLVAMRDDALERIGGGAPSFEVAEVVTDPAELDPGIARVVRGSMAVPSYLTGDGSPGSRLNVSADGLPAHAGYDYRAQFSCQVPQVAVDGAGGTSRAVVYGHGLLGSRTEVESSHVAKVASTNDMTYCATDWIGMSRDDVGNALRILGDLSLFPTLADRSQQGILDTVVLGRLMVRADGLGGHPAFQTAAGASVLGADEVYFDANSQGAIMGGAATALSPDWDRAVLGVAGMNYSLLLSRSTDFAGYFALLSAAYPDRVDQQLTYALLQMLWDRAETNGYATHLGDDPLPGSDPKQVVLHVAFGDHQVAQVAAEIEARTIGARIHQPALADGRHPDKSPFWGLEALPGSGDGNALVYFDSGALAPPPQNISPVAGEEWQAICGQMTEDQVDADARCRDPHEDPRRATASIAQKDEFFRPDGRIVDTCGGEPCPATPDNRLDY